MRHCLALCAVLLVLPIAPASAAFGEKECAAGIAMIKGEIAKSPAPSLLGKLKSALRVAEREAGERQFDECEDAVKDAESALGRK
jgi:hypothetical protein